MAAADKAGSRDRAADRRRGARRNSRPAPQATVVSVDAVPADQMILDVGPKSIEAVNAWIDKAATLVWNGPLGAFEVPPFDKATVAAARHAASRKGKVLSVAGGGETVSALQPGRRGRRLQLRLDRRRRVPRMARGQGAARRRGAPGA